MKKRIKKLWLEALRSGEYKQGYDLLVIESDTGPDEFCCLGVLTNLYVEETGDAEVWGDSSAVLSNHVKEWAELDSNDPNLTEHKNMFGDYLQDSCSECNDGLGMNFEQIADLIEEKL